MLRIDLRRPVVVFMLIGGAAIAAPIDPAAEAGYRLITPAEAAEFRARMSQLKGVERERYRDEQWARLRARAAEQGYLIPETPPWPPASSTPAATATAAPVTTEPPPKRQPPVVVPPPPAMSETAPAPATGTATQRRDAIAHHRQRLAQRRKAQEEAMQQRQQKQRDAISGRSQTQQARDEQQQATLRARIDEALDRFSQPYHPGPEPLPQAGGHLPPADPPAGPPGHWNAPYPGGYPAPR